MLDNVPPPPSALNTLPPSGAMSRPSPPLTPSPASPPDTGKRNFKMKIHRLEVSVDDVDIVIEELENSGQKYIWIDPDGDENEAVFYMGMPSGNIDDILVQPLMDMNVFLDVINDGISDDI